jgi:hypothetical protein
MNQISKFLKKIDDKGLFGYRTSYVLLRPHKLIEEIALRIKWAYQRVYRGWDDTAVWSVDIWLSEMMPDILSALLKSKQGTPFMCFDGMEPKNKDRQEYSDEQYKMARLKYEMEILTMIAGFQSAQKLISDFPQEPERDRLEKIFVAGMNSFHKYFFTLWD